MKSKGKNASYQNKQFSKILAYRIQEASTVLQYSLLLPPISTSLKLKNAATFDETIEQIADALYQNCNYFLNSFDFNVFGYMKSDCSDLSLLCMRPDFWKHVFKQDMILSAYNKLRKIISEFCPLNNHALTRCFILTTPPQKVNYIHHGFDYLSTENTSSKNRIDLTLSDENDSLTLSFKNKEEYIYQKYDDEDKAPAPSSSHAPNNNRKINTLNKHLREANLSLNPLCFCPHWSTEENSIYKINLLEFYQYTMSYKSSKSQNLGSSSILPILNAYKKINFKKLQYNKYKESVHRLLTAISLDVVDNSLAFAQQPIVHNMLTSDKIYLRYQIEKLFSPVMIDCMYQNIIPTKGKKHTLTPLLDTIAACSILPNVFTRHYILQMCLDTISKHFDYNFKDSYFTANLKEDPFIMGRQTSSNGIFSNAKLQMFSNRYSEFINYLGRFLFPIMENYFFCTLWENCPASSPAEKTLKIYLQIREYLNNNDFVHNLFKTEEIILTPLSSNAKLKPDDIIRPDFSLNEESLTDTTLYHDCIMACSPEPAEPPIPDFINLNYLNKTIERLPTAIQHTYASHILP